MPTHEQIEEAMEILGRFVQPYGAGATYGQGQEAHNIIRAALRSPRHSPGEYGSAPEKIWLNHGADELAEMTAEEWKSGEVTWCWENIHANDVPYVRADLAAPSLVSPPPDRRECWVLWNKEDPCTAFAVKPEHPPEVKYGWHWVRMIEAPEGEPDGRGGMGKDGGA